MDDRPYRAVGYRRVSSREQVEGFSLDAQETHINSFVQAQGWKLVWRRQGPALLQNAVRDFQDYLEKSMQVRVELDGRDSPEDWRRLERSIIVGTRDQLPGCGTTLKGPKDYEITATPEREVNW